MILLGSVTDLGSEHAGAHVVAGSHGGRATGLFAAAHRVSSLVCHDAGIGLEDAGVAGLEILDAAGIPAAAVDHHSARIGDPQDIVARGTISRANRLAAALGIEEGMAVGRALSILQAGAPRAAEVPDAATASGAFTRSELIVGGPDGRVRIVLLDSASSLTEADSDALVVTGSHGGLPGNATGRAIKARPRLVVFNDAGIGKDAAGIRRLGALDELGIAGLCVSAMTARIGDARSTYETGIVSAANDAAARLGVAPSQRVRDLPDLLAEIPHHPPLRQETDTAEHP